MSENQEIEEALKSGQLELFEASFISPPPPIKGDRHSAHYPLFSLQVIKADMGKRIIEVPGRKPIVILPSINGMANIDDKKILTYIVSQLAAGKNAGHQLTKKDNSLIDWIVINTGDLYKIITGDKEGSPTSSFRRTLKSRLQRLKGTQYEIDLVYGDDSYTGNFSWIGDFILPRRIAGNHGKIYIQMRPWIIKLVQSWGVQTYHPDYYTIDSPLMRRLYEIARFHVREKDAQGMYLDTLQKKTGSTGSLYKFRFAIRELCEGEERLFCDLLDYLMFYDSSRDFVTFLTKKNLQKDDSEYSSNDLLADSLITPDSGI